MKILSIDSTAEVCSVAISDNDRLLTEITINTGNTHSESLLPSVEQALRLSDVKLDEIDAFACTTGPGSFTGVRIGVATLKGLAYGKNKPCISVSTLEALAYNINGFDGIICPVMNARRSQVYNAIFKCENGTLTRLCDDRAISISDLDKELSALSLPVYLCGDGYDITIEGFKKTTFKYVPKRHRLQSGYSVAMCAYEKYKNNEVTTDQKIVPIYLRPSQAERERQARLEMERTSN